MPPDDPERAAVVALLHTSPTVWGHPRTRWTDASLGETNVSLQPLSLSGRYRRLQKWHIVRKRSRDRLTSPDPAYPKKAAAVAAALTASRTTPATHTLLYGDAFTYYRQPAPAFAYWEQGAGGHHQPVGQLSHRSNTKRRVVGALDAVTGQVHAATGSKMGVAGLRRHLRALRAAYGPDRHLTLVWDNWPVHTHPDVLTEAVAQRITLLFLPTYAPWLNPIEKFWDWLKAAVLRLHPWSDAWETLHAAVAAFLATFADGSDAVLRYVGLAPAQTTKLQTLPP